MKYWKQRNGENILIADMDTPHLTNTIEMLKRNAAPHLERNGLDPEHTHLIYPSVTALLRELDYRLEEIKLQSEQPVRVWDASEVELSREEREALLDTMENEDLHEHGWALDPWP